jgi:transcriptional regulator with AAA-type ATPase domain
LKEYDWTGNIRELRNVVERLIILGGSEFQNDVTLFASK